MAYYSIANNVRGLSASSVGSLLVLMIRLRRPIKNLRAQIMFNSVTDLRRFVDLLQRRLPLHDVLLLDPALWSGHQ